MDNPVAACSICNGPIGGGEPVVIYAGGAIAHRFRSTCEWHQEQERAFVAAIGIREEMEQNVTIS